MSGKNLLIRDFGRVFQVVAGQLFGEILRGSREGGCFPRKDVGDLCVLRDGGGVNPPRNDSRFSRRTS
jgi:hypothetical protein